MAPNTNAFLADLPAIHRTLRAWYQKAGRHDLPWRNTRDPYAIYLSEIMLQQTQVKTVLARYYGPFLARFPTLAALAEAPAQAVMKQWEGLGYYTRARNLHAAAKQSGGALPATVEALMALPGIGRNTAHAVASFAFGVPVPVMEANVKRVLCRVFALSVPEDKTLWQKAEQLLDRTHVFDYNQAMMDIGAMVCTKRAPRCGECPLARICKGKHAPERYPLPKTAKAVPVRKRTIVVFGNARGQFYLAARTTRFLSGLYGFMEYDALERQVAFHGKHYALSKMPLLGAVTQSYSHFTLEAKVYMLKVSGSGEGWFSLKQIAGLPLSRADSKVLDLIETMRESAA